eukprot:m.98530 g.98530  ORF g.98530 m.98530 type:complete len:324 (-) comp14876_c0_seq2:478-1449(-)
MSEEEDELPLYKDVEHETFHIAEYSISVKLDNGRQIVVGVSPADTLYELRQRIAWLTGANPTSLVVSYQGVPLSPARSLSDQGIWDNSTVEVQTEDKSRTLEQSVAAAAAQQRHTATEGFPTNLEDDELPSYESLEQREGAMLEGTSLPRWSIRLIGIVLTILYVALFMVLPIALIVVGSFQDCHSDQRISSWMIVMGVCTLATVIAGQTIVFLKRRLSQQGEDPNNISVRYGCITEFQSLIQTFIAVWLIVGSAWVYGCSKNCRDNCGTLTYQLAFWTLTGVFVIVFVAICLLPVLATLWATIQNQLCPQLAGRRRSSFFSA